MFIGFTPECAEPSAFLEFIPDSKFSASSQYSTGRAPAFRSRLSSTRNEFFSDIWSPNPQQVGEWVQADLEIPKIIKQIELRGRLGPDQWVTQYKLAVSQDGDNFEFLNNDLGQEEVFQGPASANDISIVDIDSVVAQYVRMYPQGYVGNILVVKWEIHGCADGKKIYVHFSLLKAWGFTYSTSDYGRCVTGFSGP